MGGCCRGRLAHGATGLAKAALGLDAASEHVRASREATCFGVSGQAPPCDRVRWGGICSACDCLIPAKIRVASESCPLGKWDRADGGRRDPATAIQGWTRPHVVQPPSM